MQLCPSLRDESTKTKIALAAACVAFCFVYIIATIFSQAAFLSDPDVFLHVSVGNWILQNGHFPIVDQFSYTETGKTWFATDWVSELIFAALYRVAQWRGLTEIVAVSAGLISGVLCFYLSMKLRLSIALGLTAIIIALISPHFLARPVIFSYLLLLVWTVLILEIDNKGEWGKRRAFVLIPLMLLWANVHASFTFGLAVFYVFLCTAIWNLYIKKDLLTLKRPLILLVGVTVAALVTPYGPYSLLKTVQVTSNAALASFNEWHTPDFQNDRLHLVSIVGLFAFIWYFGIRLRGPRFLTLVLVTVFALEYRRGLGVFALVAPLLLVRPLSAIIPWAKVQVHALDPVMRFSNKYSGTIGIACFMAAALTGIAVWTITPLVRPPSSLAPEDAIAAARRAGVSGNILNSLGFGGYLIFKGIPPFVDSRVELYGSQFLQRYFSTMAMTNPDDAALVLKHYHIEWALLAPGEPIAFMLKVNGWSQIYADDSAIVFAKTR